MKTKVSYRLVSDSGPIGDFSKKSAAVDEVSTWEKRGFKNVRVMWVKTPMDDYGYRASGPEHEVAV